jgi:predicted DNA-binding transcriptional regulator YafY
MTLVETCESSPVTGDATPTERILNLAAYLKQRGNEGASLDDIARNVRGYDPDAARDEQGDLLTEGSEWEALRRMTRRDLQDLRDAWGIDTIYDEEAHRHRLRPPFFTTQERAALIAAAAAVDVEGIDGHRGQLGAGVDDAGAQVVIRVHHYVADLRDAIQTCTVVRFEHEGRSRMLQPFALGTWHSRWYVAGWDPELEALRRYRLDRIHQHGPMERVGEPGSYEVPDWFDAVLAFDFDPNAWGRDARLRARVRVERDHLPAFLAELGGQIGDEVDGEPVVAFEVRHYESTRNRILFFRDHVQVLGPPALVALIRDHLIALAGVT